MSDINIKEVVKEKYGNAALRVGAGGSSCCGASPAGPSSAPATWPTASGTGSCSRRR